MRYLITIEYDGSKFYGFQRLNDKSTVQKELEDALSKINKNPVEIKGAGRTDRGVHALGQRAHFELDINIPTDRLINAINSLVTDYLRVTDCLIVDSDIHARFSVQKKTYRYKINLGKYSPFLQDYTLQNVGTLDITKMMEAAQHFLGVHNFELFTAGVREDYTAIIYSIDFKVADNLLEIDFVGKSFYRYMVRNLVGALLEIGKGKYDSYIIKDMLDSPTKYNDLPTASACGLYLVEIEY